MSERQTKLTTTAYHLRSNEVGEPATVDSVDDDSVMYLVEIHPWRVVDLFADREVLLAVGNP